MKPYWVDRLLEQWAVWSASGQRLGYSPVCPMFRNRVDRPAASHEPQGVTGRDMLDVDAAVNALPEALKYAVIYRYKPWTYANMFGGTTPPRGFLDERLRAAGAALAEALAVKVEDPYLVDY